MAVQDRKTRYRGRPPTGMVGAPELQWNERPGCESTGLAPRASPRAILAHGMRAVGNLATTPGPRRHCRAHDPVDMDHVEHMPEAGCRSAGGSGKAVARCRRRAPDCAIGDPTNIIGDDAGEPPNDLAFSCEALLRPPPIQVHKIPGGGRSV